MTTPESSGPDDRRKWLAGYADGELDGAARDAVEQWLAEDPDAADALRDQEQFSPSNQEFWTTAAPPEPTPAEWAAVAGRIASACLPTGQPRYWRQWAVGAGGVAAAVLFVWLATGRANIQPPPAGPVDPPDPTVVAEGLPAGTGKDSDTVAARGRTVEPSAAGDEPGLEVLTLAGPGDVVLESLADPAAGTIGAPGEAPMIFPRSR